MLTRLDVVSFWSSVFVSKFTFVSFQMGLLDQRRYSAAQLIDHGNGPDTSIDELIVAGQVRNVYHSTCGIPTVAQLVCSISTFEHFALLFVQ